MNSIIKHETGLTQKILIVEDEGEIGLALDLILSERDFEVHYAGTLLAAEKYLQQHKPSVIILDNKLPDGYGIDFISYVRKNYPSIKIIMISGFDSAREIALNNGADVFLEKPFSLKKVNEAIDEVLA
ncbi:MAG TPA: response regulator [Candidatus Babeliaceae bacterium]|nr:response regulator [Candidatus Babeliaceae bacterium]HVZ96673.1 response regulator [Chitinophagaceae bacterium]